ncbi:hypothetical protein M514_03834 [Trichuris suis]|uniref:Uncharacterized protein n=1 Tax=Trichuris suis TaxID=68888 RepID=A0A085MD97_9BILA|nr:hypothetical protein M513_03834 [Trichuris suis]KFD65445.1 hypothetical protein M514_03834 [Trichuris suis]KHJ45255.1 hypothetical protein D918_04559 [Trichuris suis]
MLKEGPFCSAEETASALVKSTSSHYRRICHVEKNIKKAAKAVCPLLLSRKRPFNEVIPLKESCRFNEKTPRDTLLFIFASQIFAVGRTVPLRHTERKINSAKSFPRELSHLS